MSWGCPPGGAIHPGQNYWIDLETAGAIPNARMGDVEKARTWVKE